MQFLLFWHHREQRNVSDSLSVFSVELLALLLALLLNGKIPAGALQSSLLPVSHQAMEGFYFFLLKYTFVTLGSPTINAPVLL